MVVRVALLDLRLSRSEVRADEAERRAVEHEANRHGALVARLASQTCLHRVHSQVPVKCRGTTFFRVQEAEFYSSQ